MGVEWVGFTLSMDLEYAGWVESMGGTWDWLAKGEGDKSGAYSWPGRVEKLKAGAGEGVSCMMPCRARLKGPWKGRCELEPWALMACMLEGAASEDGEAGKEVGIGEMKGSAGTALAMVGTDWLLKEFTAGIEEWDRLVLWGLVTCAKLEGFGLTKLGRLDWGNGKKWAEESGVAAVIVAFSA